MRKIEHANDNVPQGRQYKKLYICDPSKHVLCKKPCLDIAGYYCSNTSYPQFAKTDAAGTPIVSPGYYSFFGLSENN